MEVIREAESAEAPSAFTITQEAQLWDYNAVKEAHPDAIVLYQMGDFFEIFGPDARATSVELDLRMTTRNLPDMGRVAMCGIPGNALNEYVNRLRDKYDVAISTIEQDGKRHTVTYPSIVHEAEQALNTHEAESDLDGARPHESSTERRMELAAPAPVLRAEIVPATIDEALQQWNGNMDSKRAVVRYMENHARNKDTAAWLAREYGGEASGPLCFILAGGGGEVTLSWPKVQRRIAKLIKEDRFFTEAEQDAFEDIDPIAIREALAERGIVNGHTVDENALNNSPFIRQVMADVERLAQEEAEEDEEPPRYEATITSDAFHDPEDAFAVWDNQTNDYYIEDDGRVKTFPTEEEALAFQERLNKGLSEQETVRKPTVREIYDQYKPIVTNLVLADTAYQNACRNSDKETAIIEGDAAVKRAALTITEPEFMRLYFDMTDFRLRLHREIADETYPSLSHEAALGAIGPEDETPPWGIETGAHSPWGAVQNSNLFADGVYEISTARHGGIMVREADAKKLLSSETIEAGGFENGWYFFEEDSAAPVVIRELLDKGIPATPPYVFCRYSENQIFEDEKIYSVSEFDRLMKQTDDKHVAGKAAAMEKYGTWQKWYDANDPEFESFLGYDKVSFTVVLPDGRRLTDRQDIGDGDGGLLDHLSEFEMYRDIVPILQQAVEREQAWPETASPPPDLSGQSVTREGDTITIGTGPATHEIDITVSDKEWEQIKEAVPEAEAPARDPLAPAYKVGDTVYLKNMPFEITHVNQRDVEVRDATLAVPVFRIFDKGPFEWQLTQDPRNSHITEFLSTDVFRFNLEYRESLTSHFLTEQTRADLSDWLRSGEGNTSIAQRLADRFSGENGTIPLTNGNTATYSTDADGIKVTSPRYAGVHTWRDVAVFFRTLWQQELEGFTHGPVQRENPRDVAADLSAVNDDLREVLTQHLLTGRDKAYISAWLHSGLDNGSIALQLYRALEGRSDTVTLETGDIADYYASPDGLAMEIQDKFRTKLSMSWEEAAPVLRTLWQRELDGFTHEPVQGPAIHLEGKLSYQVGDKVAFPFGDHEISGTIGYIGEVDVRIDTGPHSWSHQTVNRKFFEEALRQDERNAALFTPEVPAQEAPAQQEISLPEPPAAPAPRPEARVATTTVYPGDKNNMPYDIVIETLRFDESEHAQPEPAPAVEQPPTQAPVIENFRITDDALGVGGPKEKFRRNMEAINTLQGIELESRSATPAEQEILSRYVGWGGLPDAFDPDKPNWTNEYLELEAALTPEEYRSARSSTLNAHYTSPTVIKAIYEAIGNMGFKTGNILEPACGVGNFFGLLPEDMSASKLYGVELDSITGRIAQQLYPKANIAIRGFEKSGYPDGFFDLAIGNVPFGQYQVRDRKYDKLGFHIHNYFFAKTLDQVRPGGVVAFVTTRYTLDAKDSTVRRYLAQRADLLGAIRLPNNAFKANAGTEVVSDIIFLQRRETPAIEEPAWVHTGENVDGFTINSYFLDHPEMILGRQASDSTQYGRQDFTVVPIEGAVLADQLHEAVKHIHGEYKEAALPELDADISETDIVSIPADPSVKNYSYAIVDGDVYYRENSVMVKPHLSATARERVKAMIGLRDCVRELIDLQMDEFTPDSAIQEKQKELGTLYDAFRKEYGLINDRANRLAFDRDSSYYLLCSLEVLDEDGRMERKADMFTKRTIKQHTHVTSAETAMDALAVSIGERAKVDLPFMAQLTGHTEEDLEKELTGVIFRDIRCAENPAHIPKTAMDLNSYPLVTADEYLSGNVRRKLHMAQALYSAIPPDQQERVKVNVEALTAAQPKDLDASEIEVRLGATWIDKSYVQQFMYETLRTPNHLRKYIQVHYSPHTAEWSISKKNSVGANDIAAYTTFGTDRANAYHILEDSLNLRDVRIYDTIEGPDGKEKRVLNAKETTLAAQKQQALRDAFKDWIWKDPQRRQRLVHQYNEEMNCIRPREYDGSHIVFSGINPEIKLLPHQVNAIAHVLYGGNTLLAHEVGAGKTFEMIASAMECKRLGLCHKSIFVVPNHLTGQTASEFLRLYPSANILVTTEKDFEKHRRKKFCARIVTGNYDAVIIGHSQFEKIPISYERQERLIQEQIWEISEGIQEVEGSGGERFTVKQLERTKRQLEARLEKLQANHRKDDVVSFEQLGVDMMFVDESDNYKNLFLYTKMRNVAGLSTTDAQKSSDMFAKCRYIDEITKGRGIVFATGTPISNSMTEMFTIQRYLQYDRLQEMGMGHFDCWASRFGETVTALELAPEGTGYRARTRFARFFNLPELMNIFKEVADIKTADQLNLPTPEVEYHTIASKPTLIQQEMVKKLSARASLVHSGSVDPSKDNMLKITSDGRKLGLDQRIIDPFMPDEEGTKVNRCVENVLKQWREGDSKKLTQLIFCDISTPKAAPSKRSLKGGGDKLDNPLLNMMENAVPLEPEKPFTIYEDIRQKLIAGGMAPEQIAFIHEAKTDVQKKALFAKVRAGQVRVLLGSTSKLGAGTNVQDLLIALHDLDCPWRPRDLIQRKGRIERRGNTNEKVHVYRYVTEGTFDAYLWQTIENKQKFISQIMTSKSPVRSCEDVDEAALSYAEIKALCAGDPRIKERMELDVDVSKLKIMKAAHQSKQFQLEDNILTHFPEQIKANEGYIRGLKKDMETLAAHPHPAIIKEKPAPEAEPSEAGDNAAPAEATDSAVVSREVSQGFAGMVINSQEYADREEAGKALMSAVHGNISTDMVEIGSYRGFTLATEVNFGGRMLYLKGEMIHRAEMGTDLRGNILRLDHALDKMPERLKAVEAQLANTLEQQKAAKAEVGKPFPQEEELRQKSARLAELDAQLNIDGGPVQEEQAIAKSERPSVLSKLKEPPPVHNTPGKSFKRNMEER